MRSLLAASVVCLLAWSPALIAAEPDAKAVIARAIKASGDKNDGKTLNMSWKDTGVVNIGGMKIEYSADFAFRAPDALRFDMSAEIMNMKFKMTSVVADGKVWELIDGNTTEIKDEKKEQSQAMVYQLWVTTLTPLNRDKEFKLSSVVGKNVNDKPTTGVLVERKDKPAVTLFFDKGTGLLVKIETNVKDEFQGWKEVLEETYYEEYKDVDGRKVVEKMRVVRDGKPFIDSKLSGMKQPDKLDAKLFEKP